MRVPYSAAELNAATDEQLEKLELELTTHARKLTKERGRVRQQKLTRIKRWIRSQAEPDADSWDHTYMYSRASLKMMWEVVRGRKKFEDLDDRVCDFIKYGPPWSGARKRLGLTPR